MDSFLTVLQSTLRVRSELDLRERERESIEYHSINSTVAFACLTSEMDFENGGPSEIVPHVNFKPVDTVITQNC